MLMLLSITFSRSSAWKSDVIGSQVSGSPRNLDHACVLRGDESSVPSVLLCTYMIPVTVSNAPGWGRAAMYGVVHSARSASRLLQIIPATGHRQDMHARFRHSDLASDCIRTLLVQDSGVVLAFVAFPDSHYLPAVASCLPIFWWPEVPCGLYGSSCVRCSRDRRWTLFLALLQSRSCPVRLIVMPPFLPYLSSLSPGNLEQLFDRDAWGFHDELGQNYGSVVKVHAVLGVSPSHLALLSVMI